MTCREVDALIVAYASGAAVPPQVGAHIAGCARCGPLAKAIRESRSPAQPSPERVSRIAAAVLTDLKPVKPLVRESALFLALLSVLFVVAAAGAEALGTAGFRALNQFQRAAVFTALAGGAMMVAFSAARQIVPGGRLFLSPRLLLTAVLGGMAGMFAAVLHPQHEAAFVMTGLVCLRIGLECAFLTAPLAWLLLRRGAILDVPLTSATVGAFAGLAGLVVLEIFCPNLNVHHVIVWHLGAALASTMGGLVVGYLAAHLATARRRF